jgi:hypothetical protein
MEQFFKCIDSHPMEVLITIVAVLAILTMSIKIVADMHKCRNESSKRQKESSDYFKKI